MKESLANFRETLANDVLQDLKQQASDAEQALEDAEDSEKKSLEKEKQDSLDDWDKKIKVKKDELDALNDETTDNETKLKKLQEERALWAKETNNVYAKSKIADLDSKIKETEKAIKKDDLQKQIDDLQKSKEADEKSYEDRLKELEDNYEEQKKAQKKANDDSLLEEKAYAQADEMIKKNQQDQILELMGKYGKSYKDVGTLLGKNFKDGWTTQIQQAKDEYDKLMGDLAGGTTSTDGNSSSDDSSSSSDMKNVWVSDGANTQVYTDAGGTESKGSL
jgi:DNA repair exonuclease SbcCD ATPase subunit